MTSAGAGEGQDLQSLKFSMQSIFNDLNRRLSNMEVRASMSNSSMAARDDAYEEGVQTNKITPPQGRLVVHNITNLIDLLVFASDAAAGVGGLIKGDLYKDAAGVVHVKL